MRDETREERLNREPLSWEHVDEALTELVDVRHDKLDRIFGIGHSLDKRLLVIKEDCDNHFTAELTKPEVAEVIAWLQRHHDEMIDAD